MELQGRYGELLTMYDAALKKDPDDGLLAYLRSRFEIEPEVIDELLARAKQNAPDSPWPWSAESYHSMARGDWPAVLTQVDEAMKRGQDPLYLMGSRHLALLATGDAQTVIDEARSKTQQDLFAVKEIISLVDAQLCLGQEDAASATLAHWKNGLQPYMKVPQVAKLIAPIEAVVHYHRGDFAALERIVIAGIGEATNTLKFELLLTRNRPQEILDNPSIIEDDPSGWTDLRLAVALHLAGQFGDAAQWRNRACEKLRTKDRQSVRAAVMLSSPEAPSEREVEHIAFHPTQKLVLLCALSQLFPELKPAIAPLAKKLNVSRSIPYHLVVQIFPPE